MTDEMKSKFQSRKFWIVIWAIIMFTGLAIYIINSKYDASWLAVTMPIIIGIPAAYVSFGVAKSNHNIGENK